MHPVTFPGCQKSTAWGDWPIGVEKLLIEPKLVDGYRLEIVVDGAGRVSFHCGSRHQPSWAVNLGHIARAVRATGIRSVMLDGVVMADTWTETVSLICRKRADMAVTTKERIAAQVRFHAFDAVPLDVPREMRRLPRRRKDVEVVPVALSVRRRLLEGIFTRQGDSPVLRLVPQYEVFSPQQLYSMLDELGDLEYEGAMVKFPESPYAFGRVNFWQKLQPMQTIELRIMGAVEGKGRMLGAFRCVLVGEPDVRMTCRGGFTDELRERLWHSWEADPDNLTGRVIVAKVQPGRVAKMRPVFLRFRDDDKASVA